MRSFWPILIHSAILVAIDIGIQGGETREQKHLNLGKLGKFLSNSTEIWAIFAKINEKSGNLYSWIR